MRIRPCGDRAFLVELDDPEHTLGVFMELDRRPPRGVIDVVAGACTVLVVVDEAADLRGVTREVLERRHASRATGTGARVDIPVHYDGVDLESVAEQCGLSVAQVVDGHAGVEYTAAFVGFVPGFAYLVGLDPQLHVPRLATPRARVPAGSVAVAAEYSAVYPLASPGGWNLIGRTSARLWDDRRNVPPLITPGMRVRFVPERTA